MKKILLVLFFSLSLGKIFAICECDKNTVLYQDIYNNYVNAVPEPYRTENAGIMFDRCMRQVGCDKNQTMKSNGFIVNPYGCDPDKYDDSHKPFWN